MLFVGCFTSRASLPVTIIALWAVAVAGQAAPRQPTTIDAIREFPSAFHLRDVVVRGELVEASAGVVLEADARRLDVALGDAGLPAGPVEVRGLLVDVGRLDPDDPRLTGYRLPDAVQWPQRNELQMLLVSGIEPVDPVVAPTIRALALEPWRFDGESVSVTGQFRGRNLYGDLPSAPAASEHDFVLRAAGGAIWVTGIEPRGRDFELRPTARVDTGQWLAVTGILRHSRGLVTLEGSIISLASAPDGPAAEPAVASTLAPAEVVFTLPTRGETAVARDVTVRLQFSRGLDPDSIRSNLAVRYADNDGPALDVDTRYDRGSSSIAVTLSGPLEPFRRVEVATLLGLLAFDGAPVVPYAFTFTTGQ